jgi:hypothetical protein
MNKMKEREYYHYVCKDHTEVAKLVVTIFKYLRRKFAKKVNVYGVRDLEMVLVSFESCENEMVNNHSYESKMKEFTVNNIIEYINADLMYKINTFPSTCTSQKRMNITELIMIYLHEYKFNEIVLKDKLTVFLSHPMSGKTDDEVESIRNKMKDNLNFVLPYVDFTFIDNYHHENAPENPNKLWHLGASIQQLGDVDCMYVYSEDDRAKGVQVEKLITELYEIPVLNDYL